METTTEEARLQQVRAAVKARTAAARQQPRFAGTAVASQRGSGGVSVATRNAAALFNVAACLMILGALLLAGGVFMPWVQVGLLSGSGMVKLGTTSALMWFFFP